MEVEAFGTLIDVSFSMLGEISLLCDCVVDQLHENLRFGYHGYSASIFAGLIEIVQVHGSGPADPEQNLKAAPPSISVMTMVAKLHTELLQAAHLLEQLSVSMTSRKPDATAPDCNWGKEDLEHAHGSPVDLVVALESACWDLDFLVCQRAMPSTPPKIIQCAVKSLI